MSDETKASISAGWFVPALALVFITLKLTGTITWSWWWVLAPLWIPVAAVAFIALLIVIVTAMGHEIKSRPRKR